VDNNAKKNMPALSKSMYMLLLDILLFVIFIFLFSPLITGLAWHEWLGIIILFPVVLHLLFSWTWIKQSTKRLLKQHGWRHKFNYLLNTILFILVVLEVVSGLVIAQVSLPSMGVKTINDWVWRALHNQASTGMVVIISLHIALNWQRIVGYFKKKLFLPITNSKKGLTFRQGLLRIFFIILAAVIISSVAYLILGTPVKARLYAGNEIARFKLNFIAGIVQLTGTIITIAILAYMAWRWLKIKL
jgi:cytochrome b